MQLVGDLYSYWMINRAVLLRWMRKRSENGFEEGSAQDWDQIAARHSECN